MSRTSRMDFGPAKRPGRPPGRGGLLDLLLVAVVVFAVWSRTPVGGLVERGVTWVLGIDSPQPTLTSYFRVERAWGRLTEHIA